MTVAMQDSILTTLFLIAIGIIGYLARKWMKDTEDARKLDNAKFTEIAQKTSTAIDKLNDTIHEIGKNLDVFQSSIVGELGAVKDTATRAERQARENEEEIADVRTGLTRLEAYCKFKHEGK